MATSISAVLDSGLVTEKTVPVAGRSKRRRIDPKTGHALVVLGHAIEYLANELVFAAGTLNADRGQMQAIQLLMAKNRDLYLACPEVPTFWQRLRSLLNPNHRESGGPEHCQARGEAPEPLL